MKNQVIKKIMAYLLVGAMVLTTPMTASANELENAYSGSRTSDDEHSNTDTGTSTNTGGKQVEVEVPAIIKKHNINILGLEFDKKSLELEAEEKDFLHVRVLLDDYDANDEELAWAALTAEDRAAIEGSIHWISMDPKVATAKIATGIKDESNNKVYEDARSTDAIIEAIGDGETKVKAWIEKDGLMYENNKNMPTKGDLVAEATVIVRDGDVTLSFSPVSNNNLMFVNQKRTYDLKKYTYVQIGKKDPVKASESSTKVIYNDLQPTVKNQTTKASITEDGKFTITKNGSKTDGFTFNAVTESGVSVTGTIDLSTESVAAVYTKPSAQIVDFADKDSSKEVDLKLTNAEKTTDDFEWKSKNAKIVDVIPGENGKATLVAKGVGKTTVSVKSSSDTKAKTFNVGVNATPDSFKFEAEGKSTYTGKPISDKLVFYGANDKENALPASAFTINKWTADTTTKDATVRKVGKLNEATITPKDVIKGGVFSDDDLKNGVSFKYTCTISYTVYSANGERVDARKASSVTSVNNQKLQNEITIKQSDIADIEVFESTINAFGNDSKIENDKNQIIGKLPNTKSDTRKTYVGKKYQYTAQAYVVSGLKVVADANLNDSIAWAASGKAATIDANGNLTLAVAGKTNITAKYISLKYTTNRKGEWQAKATKKTKTIPVQVIQNATSISFQKPVQVAKNEKAQSITFKISGVTPKKATYNITSWKAIAYDGVNKADFIVMEDGNVKAKNAKDITLDAKDKNGNFRKDAKVIIPASIKAGTVIKVAAYTDGGVVATGYIYVTNTTKKVNNITAMSVQMGKNAERKKILATLKTDKSDSVGVDAWVEGQKIGTKPVTYVDEPVTFVVDKTAAKYVRITKDGTIIPLQVTKNPVKVTVKTLSGKSTKVMITVTKESSN